MNVKGGLLGLKPVRERRRKGDGKRGGEYEPNTFSICMKRI
jgi:hypothetical protein